MKILFLTTHMNTGGITRYLLTLTKFFQKKGHQVYVVSSGGNAVAELEKEGARHEHLNIRTKSELSPKIYWNVGKVCDIVRREGIDVVHAQTRVTQVLASWVRRLTGTAYLSTCHGFFKPRWSRKLFPCWGRAVIAISAPVRRHLQDDLKVPAEKVVLIPNGVDVEEFAPGSEHTRREKRRELGLADGPVLGIIARLSDVKGHDVLVRSFQRVIARFPEAQLLIAGQGKEENALKRLVRTLNLEEHVRFYPLVEQASGLLALFDVFVMPSRQEGLGLAIMEAQACGVPVVASRVGGIPDLIADRRTGILVPPGEPELLAEAIVTVLSDGKLARTIGANAREFIVQNFSAEKMAEETLKAYEKLKDGVG